jgi:formate-dependent nitrite reductase cytochrome c552 subunit
MEEGRGSVCINCHMPKIVANETPVQLHHHGFSKPNPLKTLRWGSPNTCTICHGGGEKLEMVEKMITAVREWGMDLLPVNAGTPTLNPTD